MAGVFLRKDQVFITGLSQAKAGFWIVIGPVWTASLQDDILGEIIIKALAHSKSNIDLDSNPYVRASIGSGLLKASGAKSLKQFENNSRNVLIREDCEYVTLTPRLADLNMNTVGQGEISCKLDRNALTYCLRQALELAV